MKLSSKMKSEIKKRLTSATVLLAVLVLVFVCSKNVFENVSTELRTATVVNSDSSAKNEIAVIKDSTGININITAVDENDIDLIEVYQGTNKIKEYNYSDNQTVKEESFNITIPFGETHQITVMVNGETAAQKDVQNMRYISTAQDMVSFRDIVNSGNNFSGKYVELLSNIDLSTVCSSTIGSFIPISEFYGTFNGNYYSIDNLYMNDNTRQSLALFSYVYSSTIIENVIIKNIYVYNTYRNTTMSYTGGITAGSEGQIINCGVLSGYIEGRRTDNQSSYNATVVGGVVGANNGKLSKCFNTANVYSQSGTGNYNNQVRVGGIAGTNNKYEVSNCYNRGTVVGRNGNLVFVGGIVGTAYAPGNVYNCYNASAVSGSGSSTNIGGILGRNGDGTAAPAGGISNCYCSTATTYSYYYASGNRMYTTQSGRVDDNTLKGYATTLNTYAYASDSWGINAGYPVLRWQIPTIEFDKKQIYANVGENIQLNLNTLKYTAASAMGNLTYTSDNPDVAMVDNSGMITAVGEGSTTIYATESTYGLKAMMIVNVARSGAIAFAQSESGGLDITAKYTIVLKEDGTVWRNRR